MTPARTAARHRRVRTPRETWGPSATFVGLGAMVTTSVLGVSPAAADASAPVLDAPPVDGLVTDPLLADPLLADAAPVGPPTPQRVLPGRRLEEKPPPPPPPPAWVLPVEGYELTGRFGASSSLWSSTHTGLDFAAAEGTDIRAVAAGEVVSADYDGAFGLKTVVELGDGTEVWFCHQSDTDVEVGEQVAPGEVIGAVGSTGNVTGPHLHLEVHPGGDDPVDPDAWLSEHGVAP